MADRIVDPYRSPDWDKWQFSAWARDIGMLIPPDAEDIARGMMDPELRKSIARLLNIDPAAVRTWCWWEDVLQAADEQDAARIVKPTDRANAENRHAVVIAPANPFKAMDGLKWSEVAVTFIGLEAVRIKARRNSETFTYEVMGFRNRKSFKAEPNRCWETFKCLAVVSTSDKSWDAVSRATFKKRMSQLRKQLQLFFGIADNPIAYRKGVGYQPVFNLAVEEHVTRSLRDQNTSCADEDEDDDIQREMSDAPYI